MGRGRDVDPHLFKADPDPTFFLNADPDADFFFIKGELNNSFFNRAGPDPDVS